MSSGTEFYCLMGLYNPDRIAYSNGYKVFNKIMFGKSLDAIYDYAKGYWSLYDEHENYTSSGLNGFYFGPEKFVGAINAPFRYQWLVTGANWATGYQLVTVYRRTVIGKSRYTGTEKNVGFVVRLCSGTILSGQDALPTWLQEAMPTGYVPPGADEIPPPGKWNDYIDY